MLFNAVLTNYQSVEAGNSTDRSGSAVSITCSGVVAVGHACLALHGPGSCLKAGRVPAHPGRLGRAWHHGIDPIDRPSDWLLQGADSQSAAAAHGWLICHNCDRTINHHLKSHSLLGWYVINKSKFTELEKVITTDDFALNQYITSMDRNCMPIFAYKCDLWMQ